MGLDGGGAEVKVVGPTPQTPGMAAAAACTVSGRRATQHR